MGETYPPAASPLNPSHCMTSGGTYDQASREGLFGSDRSGSKMGASQERWRVGFLKGGSH